MKHGGDRLGASRRFGIPVEKILDFSANINPFGPSPQAVEAILGAIPEVAHYPEPNQAALAGRLAAYLGVGEDQVVLGNGAAELIDRLLRTLQPKGVVAFPPTFSEYGLGAHRCRIPYREVPWGGEGWARIEAGDLVFLCNPNNPTGKLLNRNELAQIRKVTEEKGAWLVVDESFRDFTAPLEAPSAIPWVADHPRVLVLYSLTKFFALPGLRLGSLIAPQETAAALREGADPWVVNVMALRAGEASLTDEAYINRSKAWIAAERPFLYNGLQAIPGFRPYEPAANFVLVDVAATGRKDHEWVEALGRKGILVRSCSSFRVLGDHHLRLAVRTREENLRLLEALQALAADWEV